jgi:hypothetical protein
MNTSCPKYRRAATVTVASTSNARDARAMYLGDAAVCSVGGVSDGVMAVILGSLERGRRRHCSGYVRV